MANTYTLISSVTVGSGGAANIDFTSIPSTYTDLSILCSIRTDRPDYAESLQLRFNSSTSNYTTNGLSNDGNSVISSSTSGETGMLIGILPGSSATASTFGNGSIYIPNYAGSNNKSVSVDTVTESNNPISTTTYLRLWAGLWSDSSAITSIRLYSRNSYNFVQYSTAYLYGISNA
jgi:hypothetical protein